MKTAITQLQNWITKYKEVNGTPTLSEIEAQIDMFKEIEKQQIIDAAYNGYNNGQDETFNGEDYYCASFND